MGMIGEERPSKTKGFRLGDDITQAFNKIIPVLIIGEYPPTLDSTNNNMMQGSGSSMRALRGIQPLHHSTPNYKSYNFMGVPNIPRCA
jgi:hypothetical protein